MARDPAILGIAFGSEMAFAPPAIVFRHIEEPGPSFEYGLAWSDAYASPFVGAMAHRPQAGAGRLCVAAFSKVGRPTPSSSTRAKKPPSRSSSRTVTWRAPMCFRAFAMAS